ncbi:MAG: hypothetical protein IMX01_07050 [Limnochordaceae bacterium]|nr:hypothetical protein [Limnochordaceae bacterium]
MDASHPLPPPSPAVEGQLPPFGTVVPMLATAGPAFDSDQFAYEVKWDGFRALAFLLDPGHPAGPGLTLLPSARSLPAPLRLQSRNGKDLTGLFPSLQVLAEMIPPREWPLLLDGEIVAFAGGLPDFAALQRHLGWSHAWEDRSLAGWPGLAGIPSAGQTGISTGEIFYVVFDILFRRSQDLRTHTWQARHETLQELVAGLPAPLLISKAVFTTGRALFAACREQGLEGIVAKRLSSTYQAGRSRDWIKTRYRPQLEAVVGGWLPPGYSPGSSRHSGRSGLTLLLGLYAGSSGGKPDGADRGRAAEELRFIGGVGTGWKVHEESTMLQALERIAIPTPPFAGLPPVSPQLPARWAEPVLVASVEYSGWTVAGRLRQPVWKGWRPDKAPQECRWPPT